MITHLKYGNTNTYFIRGKDKGLLVDTDWMGTLPLLYKVLKAQGLSIQDVGYVLATHYHPDHMGLVSELNSLGIPLLLMDVQQNAVHNSDHIFRREKRSYTPIDPAAARCISCAESRSFLKAMGIDGEILHTIGHSDDSVSLILDSGIAIVGDLDPLYYLDGYSDDHPLHQSWAQILAHSPHRICYGHAPEQRI